MRYSNSYDQPTFIHSCCISNFHQKKSNQHFRQKAEKNALKNAQNMTTKLSLCLYEHYDYAKPRSFSTRSLIFSTAIHCLAFFLNFFLLLLALYALVFPFEHTHTHTHIHFFYYFSLLCAREWAYKPFLFLFLYLYTHFRHCLALYMEYIYMECNV